MLYEEYDLLEKHDIITKELIPDAVIDNLNPAFPMRDYQFRALSRFEYYWEKRRQQGYKSTHLMFQLATGAGKTLLMAANILSLYSKGYRNFLFFVNSDNIIEKTKQNFLARGSSKYLFNDFIEIDGQRVYINHVSNFSEENPTDINIIFKSIQELHSIFTTDAKENDLTIEDFKMDKIVLLSDESHHINAEIKKKPSTDEEIDLITWGNIVNQVYGQHPENVLLEYTATAEIERFPQLVNKYKDIMVFDYPLKKFRLDRFSKEVKVVQSDARDRERVFHALIVSQYRKRIAELYGIRNFKPVVLVKGKDKAHAKRLYESFEDWIVSLDGNQIEEIINHVNKSEENNLLKKALSFFENQGISATHLAEELKVEFAMSHSLLTYSGVSDQSKKLQISLNTLEEPNNPYRILFVVKQLTEGWDVLNLFDIVRTDENSTTKQSTTQDAQLIGRGARYFPFVYKDYTERFKRKFDNEPNHDLRALEELYYYSLNNPSYIQELHKQLTNIGMSDETKHVVQLKVKQNFVESSLYKTGLLFENQEIPVPILETDSLSDIIDTPLIYDVTLSSSHMSVATILDEKIETEQESEIKLRTMTIADFEKRHLLKAIQKVNFYRFSNLKRHLIHLKSIKEFISDDKYLPSIFINLYGTEEIINQLSAVQSVRILMDMLLTLQTDIKKSAKKRRGSLEFSYKKIKDINFEKTLYFSEKPLNPAEVGGALSEVTDAQISVPIKQENWYAYEDNFGTSEEKYFLKLMYSMTENLNELFDEYYVIRNERFLRLYRFEDGVAMEPDFILLCKKQREDENALIYQVFIEAKGDGLLEKDEKKEVFLKEIADRYTLSNTDGQPLILWDENDFKLIGLPFYNKNLREQDFITSFQSEVLDQVE